MTFNGHKNWNHWNVSLWINNDVELYTMARHFIRVSRNNTRAKAAQEMFRWLVGLRLTKTPDGAPYSVTAIKAAMVGM